MLDFGRCDELQLGVVREVIDALASSSDINPDDLMVVGASCRDILHSAFGHGFPRVVRRTSTSRLPCPIGLPSKS
jgi:predicted nucleotidyltransferase